MKRETAETSHVVETLNPALGLGSMSGKSSLPSVSGTDSPRQFVIHRRRQDGVEVPPNAFDLPMQATSSHHIIRETFMAKQTYSKTNFHRDVSPVKTMANEKSCDRENTKRGGPSVVARLMGMDSLPTETRPTIHLKERLEENPRKFISRVPRFDGNKTEPSSLSSNTLKQPKEESPLNHDKHYSSPSTKSLSSVKPLRREHPQEELLQKFKKDFEAWQASKAWGNLDHNVISHGQKGEHVSGQNFNMEKKKPNERDTNASVNKHDGNLSEQWMPRTKDDVTIRKKLAANSIDPVSNASFHDRRSCSPTRIVILRPSTDTKEEMIESWRGSSEVLGRSGRMEDFLEEVKERLRLELEGKGRKESIKRGSETHASLHERPADPKQLARDVSKHMRESVRDLGAPFIRSKSTKIYMDDFNSNEKEISEAMKMETRKLLPHRMKNILKDDSDEKTKSNDQRVGNSLMQEDERTASISGASIWEDKKAVNESIPKHLRREQATRGLLDAEAFSPPNFIRSFSAPASGTELRKFFLENRHLGSGSPGLCDDESTESDSAVFNKNKKDGFNIKGKVSNLTRNFSLKGKIFGKKVSSMGEFYATETMPNFVRNFIELQDNPTEVPPSPASFSSSPVNFHHSHGSPVEAPSVGNISQMCHELGINSQERISQPETLGNKGSEGVATEAQPKDTSEVTNIEGPAESYLRNILAVSGICKDWPLSHQLISSLCCKTNPLDSWVFHKVEENYNNHGKVDDDKSGLSFSGINVGRKVLFDLANELLLTVLGVPTKALPNGTKLLDSLLHQMKMYARPKVDQPLSVDKLLALDVKLAPSLTAFHEDTNSIGEELGLVFVDELIDELVSDLLL